MYPLSEGMFAPLNQWYVAAWSSEVTRKPMERCLLDKPLAFYRKQDGGVVAVDGRCPHRHYPLGKSEVVGDNLQCGYHGLTFNPDGQCVRIPSQQPIPSSCNIRSYPVAERWQWIWIWMGDPAKCDESLIPDHDAMDLGNPEFDTFPKAYYLIEGRHMLMHDNLLDLTHLAYLHSKSIGSPEIAEANLERSQTERTLHCRSVVPVKDLPAYFRRLIDYDGDVDRSWGSNWFAPSLHFIYEDFQRSANDPQAPGEMLLRGRIFHAVTPATRHTCHYFFASGRDKSSGEDREAVVAAVRPVLDEDIFAVVEIEKMVQAAGGNPKDVLLRADAHCVSGRRLMERLIRGDEEPAQAPSRAEA